MSRLIRPMGTMFEVPLAPPFSPASLNSTSFNNVDFAGLPWLGTASAGISVTASETTLGTDPTVGAPLNGLDPIRYDLSLSQRTAMKIAGASDIGDYVAIPGYTVWGLIFIEAAAARSLPPYGNSIVIAGDARWGIYITSDEGMGVWHFTGIFPFVDASNGAAPCSVGAWHFFCVRFDSGTLKVQIDIDNVAGTPTTLAACTFLGGVPADIGLTTFAGAHATQFKIRERATSKVVISDATRDLIYGYLKAKYPAAGLP